MINGFRNLPINANLEAREKTRRRVVFGTVYFYMGAAEGCGSALQVDCLEGFDTPASTKKRSLKDSATL